MATYSIHGNIKKLNKKFKFSGKLSFWHDFSACRLSKATPV
jgi:hypothetical protein